jgi:environmental stress-induced protein Ves
MPQSPPESLRIRRRSSFRTIPWKNGGGLTHEAIRVPESGDSFRWRISVAEVDASGPFSDFRGYQRKMVLLRGVGLTLNFADGERRQLQQIGDLVEFDGARSAHCELLAGPCVDLNLMVADAFPPVRARVLNLPVPVAVDCAAGESLVVFAITGSVLVRPASGAPAILDPWDLAVVSEARSGITTLQTPVGNPAAQVFIANLSDT